MSEPATAAGRAKAALIARMTRNAETVFGPMPDDQFIRALGRHRSRGPRCCAERGTGGGGSVISQTPTDPGDIGEPRVSTMDDTTYVSVPEFELWPTDPDWQPHDARIVYITRRSFTLNAPGHMTYHRPSRHTRHSDRTGCGIDIWSSGWEPGEQSSLIAIRRDVASRIARPCRVCGAD